MVSEKCTKSVFVDKLRQSRQDLTLVPIKKQQKSTSLWVLLTQLAEL
jgi:hypothetical protein